MMNDLIALHSYLIMQDPTSETAVTSTKTKMLDIDKSAKFQLDFLTKKNHILL